MNKSFISRYESAAALLPEKYAHAALVAPRVVRERAEEFRLRVGRPLEVAGADIDGGFLAYADLLTADAGDIDEVLERATHSSVHTATESIRNGFVTAQEGHRVGLCGSALVRDGQVTGMSRLSSVCVRIAKEVRGIGECVVGAIRQGEGIQSTLILSPPGLGKTTLLRDLVRVLSDGGVRVALADERGEIAAGHEGRPTLDVGARTDVIEGCPKAAAVLMLMRAMSPQVIAVDEITAPEDIRAMSLAAHCGLSLLATAHASAIEDLARRPLYRKLIGQGLFTRAAVISRGTSGREYTVLPIGEGRA